MSQQVGVWWHKQKRAWCTEINRKRFTLAKGRKNKQFAQTRLDALLAEQKLLAEVVVH